MIRFGELYIEAFGSIIAPTTYDLGRKGLNLLKGPVGSGKTSVVDAFMWVTYGTRTKSKATVNPWPHVIDKTYKGTKVTLKFTNEEGEYRIERYSEWKGKMAGKKIGNGLFLFRPGEIKHDSKLKSIPDVKKEIIKILGYTPELFKASILFGQRSRRFMEETGPQRKKIMEEAFRVNYISKALEIGKKKLNEETKYWDKLEMEENSLIANIETQKDFRKQLRDQKKKFQQNKIDQVEDLKCEIIEIQDKIQTTTDNNEEIAGLKSKIAKIQEKISKLKSKANIADLENKEFKLTLSLKDIQGKLQDEEVFINKSKLDLAKPIGECVLCGKPIDKAKLKEQKAQIKKGIKSSKSRLKEYIQLVDSYKKNLKGIERDKASKKKIHIRITNKQEELSKLEDTLSELDTQYADPKWLRSQLKKLRGKLTKKESEEFTGDINSISKKIKGYKEQLDSLKVKLKTQRKVVEDLEWVVKDPLSNGGLKSFIMDTMIEKLNRELSTYTKYLGFKVSMGINMDSVYKDFYIHIHKQDDEISSHDLSGGQTQLVNFIIALSCHEIINMAKPTNTLIMDECFEGLDDATIETISDILKLKSKDISIHLITHRNFNPPNVYITQASIDNHGRTQFQ